MSINGLNVAFLDGSYQAAAYKSDPSAQGPACPHYTEADVAYVKREISNLTGELDLLLTCEWPRGVMAAQPPPAGYVEAAGEWL